MQNEAKQDLVKPEKSKQDLPDISDKKSKRQKRKTASETGKSQSKVTAKLSNDQRSIQVTETLVLSNDGIPFSRQLNVDLEEIPNELRPLIVRCVNLGLTLGSTGFATLLGTDNAITALQKHLSRVSSRLSVSPIMASGVPGDTKSEASSVGTETPKLVKPDTSV